MNLKTNKKSLKFLLLLSFAMFLLFASVVTMAFGFSNRCYANTLSAVASYEELQFQDYIDSQTETYSNSSQVTISATKTPADFASVVPEGSARLLTGNASLPDEDAFILTIFGDGFTSSEQSSFFTNAQNCANAFMTTSPMNEPTVASLIKIYAVGVVSNSNHIMGDGCSTKDLADNDISNTYFHTRYWVSGIERLMYIDSSTNGWTRLYELRDVFVPYTDSMLILSNSTKYGGGGGTIAVCSIHAQATNIFIHELGHSVAGLGDEYWSGDSYYQEKVNKTTQSDPALVSWSRFIGLNGIGVYPYQDQINSSLPQYYKPAENCMMRNYYPFCEVCKEEIRKSICKYSRVTKLFYQQYADIVRVGITSGPDMLEYFIFRKGVMEATANNMSASELTVNYYKNNVRCSTIPNEQGTYEVEVIFAGNEVFEACSLRVSYNLEARPSSSCSHSNITTINAVSPTCTTAGNNKYYFCEVCNEYFKNASLTQITTVSMETLPATGHNLEVIAGVAPTCTTNGNNQYFYCKNCSNYYKDSNCSTITYPSQQILYATGHKTSTTWQCDSSYHWHTCNNQCGTMLSRSAHIWDNGTILKQKTETEDGSIKYTCTTCAYEKLETLPATGHTVTIVEAVSPTCLKIGNIKYWHCSTCNKNFADENLKSEITMEQIVIPKLNHNAEETWQTNQNYHWHRCSNGCGTELDKDSHTPSEWIVVRENTFEQEGFKHKVCTICNYEIETATIPMREEGKVSVNINITTNSDGTKNFEVELSENIEYVLEYYNSEGQKLAAKPTTDGTYKVVVVILTEGYEPKGTYEKTFTIENSSSENNNALDPQKIFNLQTLVIAVGIIIVISVVSIIFKKRREY